MEKLIKCDYCNEEFNEEEFVIEDHGKKFCSDSCEQDYFEAEFSDV